eukprot:6457033-Amphidinium_carterae.1
MSLGKTCAEDRVVAEMLIGLPEEVYDKVAEVFRLRLLNLPPVARDNVWDRHVVRLIKKTVLVKSLTDVRPIAVLPVIYK